MRLTIFLALLLGFAAPAAADAPSHLKSLEQQLRVLESANPGNVGIAALDLSSGEMVSVRGDEPFPMASVVKVAIAAQYLAQVENGRRTLDQQIGGRPARRHLEAMIIKSNNLSTDIILRDLGGPKKVQEWLSDNQIRGRARRPQHRAPARRPPRPQRSPRQRHAQGDGQPAPAARQRHADQADQPFLPAGADGALHDGQEPHARACFPPARRSSTRPVRSTA